MLREWLQFGLNFLGLLAVIGLAVDRWVHKQDLDSHDLHGEVRRIKERLNKYDERFEEASRRSSEKGSLNQRRIGQIEVDLATLKAIIDMQRHQGE